MKSQLVLLAAATTLSSTTTTAFMLPPLRTTTKDTHTTTTTTAASSRRTTSRRGAPMTMVKSDFDWFNRMVKAEQDEEHNRRFAALDISALKTTVRDALWGLDDLIQSKFSYTDAASNGGEDLFSFESIKARLSKLGNRDAAAAATKKEAVLLSKSVQDVLAKTKSKGASVQERLRAALDEGLVEKKSGSTISKASFPTVVKEEPKSAAVASAGVGEKTFVPPTMLLQAAEAATVEKKQEGAAAAKVAAPAAVSPAAPAATVKKVVVPGAIPPPPPAAVAAEPATMVEKNAALRAAPDTPATPTTPTIMAAYGEEAQTVKPRSKRWTDDTITTTRPKTTTPKITTTTTPTSTTTTTTTSKTGGRPPRRDREKEEEARRKKKVEETRRKREEMMKAAKSIPRPVPKKEETPVAPVVKPTITAVVAPPASVTSSVPPSAPKPKATIINEVPMPALVAVVAPPATPKPTAAVADEPVLVVKPSLRPEVAAKAVETMATKVSTPAPRVVEKEKETPSVSSLTSATTIQEAVKAAAAAASASAATTPIKKVEPKPKIGTAPVIPPPLTVSPAHTHTDDDVNYMAVADRSLVENILRDSKNAAVEEWHRTRTVEKEMSLEEKVGEVEKRLTEEIRSGPSEAIMGYVTVLEKIGEYQSMGAAQQQQQNGRWDLAYSSEAISPLFNFPKWLASFLVGVSAKVDMDGKSVVYRAIFKFFEWFPRLRRTQKATVQVASPRKTVEVLSGRPRFALGNLFSFVMPRFNFNLKKGTQQAPLVKEEAPKLMSTCTYIGANLKICRVARVPAVADQPLVTVYLRGKGAVTSDEEEMFVLGETVEGGNSKQQQPIFRSPAINKLFARFDGKGKNKKGPFPSAA